MRIADLALKENFAEGPFPVSGGVIHRITAQQAEHVGEEIAAASNAFGTEVPLICAYVRGEGNFDPSAENPNNENAPDALWVGGVCIKGGTWPDDATRQKNTDYGLCQINGDSRYLGDQGVGLSLQELCAKVNHALMYCYLRGYPIEVALEAYNKGLYGAVAIYQRLVALGKTPAEAVADGSLEYGRNVLTRYKDYVTQGVV